MTEIQIDYKSLLIKYMNHVGHQEGVYFLGTCLKNNKLFSNKEIEELKLLSKEANKIE